LHEKVHQGATQGAKFPQALWQAREIAVSLAFSRVFTHITKGEQHLRRRSLYPAELRKHTVLIILLYEPCFVKERINFLKKLFIFLPLNDII
jgi:hypothetical protein